MTSLEEFALEFFQDVVARADSEGKFTEEAFFEAFCEHLMDAGEFDGVEPAPYRGPASSGVRVDGYDLNDDTGTLSLIISVFQQSPDLVRLVRTEMNTVFERLRRFLERVFDDKWRNSLEETSPGFGLADLVVGRWPRIGKVRFALITNRQLSERVDGREAESFDGREVTFSVWDIERLHRFVRVGHGREDIQIDLEKDFGGALPVLPAHLAHAGYKSFLAAVPGSILAQIYDRWGARLLEQNVRVFLQARGNVNKGIRTTLETDPKMFFAYNNGITATAEGVDVDDGRNPRFLRRLKNFQIVNGGQTTASIHLAHRNKVDLSRVFVQMKLSVVEPDRVDGVVPEMSKYANTQNRVNAADFFANHPFHVRVEYFSRRVWAPSPDGTFKQTKWFYERARGQYVDARSGLTGSGRQKFDLEFPKRQMFSKTDLAKFLNVWHGIPHVVSLGAQKNFARFASGIGKAWIESPDGFNENWYREAVAKAIIFKATERIVTHEPWYQGGYRANIVAYAIAKLAEDVAGRKLAVDFQAVWRRQAPGRAMESALAVAGQGAHEFLVNPDSRFKNVTEWAKQQACWTRIQEAFIDWPKAFLRELISREEEKDRQRDGKKDQEMLNGIQAQTAVVDSGGMFWKEALVWGREHRLLSPTDAGVLDVCSRVPNQLPTEQQSLRAMAALKRLQEAGYTPPHLMS